MAEAVGSFYEAVAGIDPLTKWTLPTADTLQPAKTAPGLAPAAAAGLTIRAERITPFRERFEAVVAETLSPEAAQPILALDDEVGLDEVTFPLVGELAALAPFGIGNPEPLLTTRGCAPRSRTERSSQ